MTTSRWVFVKSTEGPTCPCSTAPFRGEPHQLVGQLFHGQKLHQKLWENIDGRIETTHCVAELLTLCSRTGPEGQAARWFVKMLTMCDRLAGRIIQSFWLPKSHVKYWSLLIWLIWLIGLLVWCLEPMAFSSSESSSRAYPIEKAWGQWKAWSLEIHATFPGHLFEATTQTL